MGDSRGVMDDFGLWQWVVDWVQRCQWTPCRIARILWKVGQSVWEVYNIVVNTWQYGIEWARLVDTHYKWVALFLWACLIHIFF